MEHAAPTLPKGHAMKRRPTYTDDYWVATAVVAIILLAFLMGLAVAQVTT